jgi:hypothetical protein
MTSIIKFRTPTFAAESEDINLANLAGSEGPLWCKAVLRTSCMCQLVFYEMATRTQDRGTLCIVR